MDKPCPICDKGLIFEDEPSFVFCDGCDTNFWIPDLLVKEPMECDVSWAERLLASGCDSVKSILYSLMCLAKTLTPPNKGHGA